MKELVPRSVVGFVLSAFAMPLCSVLLGIANAVAAAMVGDAAPTTQTVTKARTHVVAAMTDESTALIAVIVGLLVVVLMFMVGGFVVRIAVLVRVDRHHPGRYITGKGSVNAAGIIVRAVLVQAVTSRLAGLGRYARPMARART